MNANRQLKITTGEDAKSTEKLSSGYRINCAADDAAGLSISEKMRWQIRGLNKCDGNIEDGISLLKVADGALNEVHSMLDRLKELSVQAANDVNTVSDRQAIQQEVNSLIGEIDRIGNDTEFNTRKVFKGEQVPVLDANGNPVTPGGIDFSQVELADVNLQNDPFFAGSGGGYLNLSASVENYGITWPLIFSNGNTSHSSLRATYQDGTGNTQTVSCNLENMQPSGYNYDATTNTYSRILSYNAGNGVSFAVTQTIAVGTHSGQSQFYNISYNVENTGTVDADIDFMFNADTAYNNRDSVEGYFVDGGNRVENFCAYTTNPDYLALGSPYIYDNSQTGLSSFSIVNVDAALPFAEKIVWSGGTPPETVSIGYYYDHTGDWNYYDNNNLAGNLGGNTRNKDLAFSLIWSNTTLTAGSSADYSFQYGIEAVASDHNLSGVPITPDSSTLMQPINMDLWIQMGATAENGMFINVGEMDSTEIGINGLDVTNYTNACNAIAKVDSAIEKISKQRSSIGAQQNRLEHAKAVDNNTEENTQAAESQIRDTDMASEMVKHSLLNILSQAGQSMLAQANQSKQSVLQLFQ